MVEDLWRSLRIANWYKYTKKIIIDWIDHINRKKAFHNVKLIQCAKKGFLKVAMFKHSTNTSWRPKVKENSSQIQLQEQCLTAWEIFCFVAVPRAAQGLAAAPMHDGKLFFWCCSWKCRLSKRHFYIDFNFGPFLECKNGSKYATTDFWP